ncbi:hypothetical protein AMELA_G00244120 [Ameiurus melas]|uniref:Uncharacterized protein n=1 Tax=Ameiurus melas TaxID=219545 RepID=A0A7J5ZV37_AMEME|nr:hypothetical protein AMELA_G00244120 [Ameiurus melas]
MIYPSLTDFPPEGSLGTNLNHKSEASHGVSEKKKNLCCVLFMFDFRWKGETWGIDAVREGSSGRLVNDDHKHPNYRMKKTEVDGSHIFFCLL